MAVGFFDVGTERIWLCSYNPTSIISILYADAIVGLATEKLDGLTRDDVHGWLRQHIPNCKKLLDMVESGKELPRLVQVGEFPVTPGKEVYEIPIVSFLKGKQAK